MAELDGLIDMIPIGDIARRLGISEKEASAAVKTALPSIVAGLSANASSGDGAAKLEKTLGKHTTRSTNVADVDEEDGKKIVNHVFGPKKEAVETAAAGKADVSKDIIAKILPIVAPIVLAWLAQKLFSGKKDSPAASGGSAKESGGVDIGGVLGGLLGGNSGGLGDLLGGLLGGGSKK